MNLGKILKRLRGLKGLNQNEVAKSVGVDPAYISMLESGKRDPSMKVLEGIAGKLECPVSVIMYLAETSETHEKCPEAMKEQASQILLEMVSSSEPTK